MKHYWIPGALFVALGVALAQQAQANHEGQELNCHFSRDKGQECTATLTLCPEVEGIGGCRPGYRVVCDGQLVKFAPDPSVQVIDQDGIGVTLLGADSSSYPHVAVDQAITRPFQDVFAHLYLTPRKRLSGSCWSSIQLGGGVQ